MGGRGSASKVSWKTQLRQMAKRGQMPGAIYGTRDVQRKIILEIDKLYPMPEVKTVKIVDQGGSVWVNFGSSVSRGFYPSGDKADEAEKRGVLKMLLWKHKT